MKMRKPFEWKQRWLVSLTLAFTLATVGFLLSERASSRALDVSFLDACDGRWQGPNQQGEYACKLSLSETKDQTKAQQEYAGLMSKANGELLKLGWIQKQECYLFPSTTGHLEIGPITEYDFSVTDKGAPKLLQWPSGVHILMVKPHAPLRGRMRDAWNALRQRITGRSTDLSTLRCKPPAHLHYPSPRVIGGP